MRALYSTPRSSRHPTTPVSHGPLATVLVTSVARAQEAPRRGVEVGDLAWTEAEAVLTTA